MKVQHLAVSVLLACGLLIALFVSLAGILARTASPVKAQTPPAVRFVAPFGNDTGNNCVDPNNPCATIQHAVDMAGPGDEIRIAEGVYTHTFQRNGITQSVYISKSLFLRGGYTTTTWASAPPPDPERYQVVIAPFGKGRGIVITPSVDSGVPMPDVRIEALEIFEGNAAGLGGGPWMDAGGGIYAVSATLALTNVGVVSSTADTGGGIYARDVNLEMRFSYLVSNTVTTGCGGGLYLGKNIGAIFADNKFQGNTSWSGNGGGVCIEDSSEVTWKSAKFENNYAYANGGGVWVMNSFDVFFERIWAQNNRSEYGGGAFHFDGADVGLVNVLVVDNEVGAGDGTAISLYNNSDVELYHATVVRNKGTSAGAALDVKLSSVLTTVNTILVGHETGIQVGSGAQAVMTATLWGAGTWANTNNWVNSGGTLITGTINIFDVPRFHDPGADDYHLQPTSPAVDAGVSTFVLVDGDFEPRPIGPAPDLGADEVPYKAVDPNKDDQFVYTDTQGISMTLDVPAGSTTETVKLAITKREEVTEPVPSGWRLAGLAFDMDAYKPSSQDPAEGYRFQRIITMTIRYRDQDVQGVPEETLKLLFWDKNAGEWKDIAEDCGTSYQRYPAQNMLRVGVCHLTKFALLGLDAPIRLFLPAVMR